MNASVSFKVSGNELSNYIDQIQKKSDALTNSAIQSANEQTNAAKEQLRVINEQIQAYERKSRLETEAARTLLLEKKEAAIQANRERHIGEKNQVFSRQDLSEQEVKEKVSAIEGREKTAEDAIKAEYKEQLGIVREQERQSKLQTTLSREAIHTAKEAAREQVKAIQTGDKTLADVYKEVGQKPSDEEKLTLSLIEQQLQIDKKKEEKGKGERKEGFLGSLLAVDNINKLVQIGGQFSQTQNGFDLIQPASNLAGRIIGGAIGGLVGALAGGVGAVGGAAVGASIGGGFGDVLGTYQQREALTKENFFKARNRYRGITGANMDSMSIPDLENSGVSAIQFMQMQSDFARKRAGRDGSANTTKDAINLEKALGVDQGTSALIIELQRSAKENNKDLSRLIGGIVERGSGSIFKGGDNTFLNEFLGKFSVLQKELLKNSTNVASGLTMDALKQFNSMGGMFDVRDPRSMGIISSINGSLSNPQADNMRAMAFGVLRNQNPNAGIFDLREEMSKGLGSPEYLKGMLGMIDRMGGDDQMKMNNLSGMFQGVPLSAIRTLFKNRKGLKSFDTSELSGIGLTDDVLSGMAGTNTTDLERGAAKIENGILGGQAVDKMADAFVVAIKAMLGGAVINLNNGQGNITLSPSQIKNNSTRTAQKQQNDFSRNFDGSGNIYPSTFR